ncbi:MAG: hypothetical protein ACUVV0_10030 [Anaerolineae bacterium]
MSKSRMLLVVLLASTVILAAGATAFARSWGSPGLAPLMDRLSAEVQISPPASPDTADRYLPAVAHNYRHNEYLVVWHNTWSGPHRDIYARRVSGAGQLLSWFAVSAGSNDRVQPAVAYNATNDEYLVVWMYDVSGNGTKYEIWGRIVAWNGSYMGSPKLIITWTNRSFWTPRVVWNSYRNQYMVVWNAIDTTTGLASDVAGYRVSASGDVINPGSPIIISASNTPHQVDIAYNLAADEYLAVWRRMRTTADWDIRGARLRGDNGAVVTPPGEFFINSETVDQRYPAVTTNTQDRYLVVWQHAYSSTDWDIKGQYLNISGGTVGSSYNIASTGANEMYPDVASADPLANEYVTVWQIPTSTGTAIRARRNRLVGSTITSLNYFDVASYGFWDSEKPVVACGSPGFLFAYEGDSASDPAVKRHIYGRVWWPNALYLPFIMKNLVK